MLLINNKTKSRTGQYKTREKRWKRKLEFSKVLSYRVNEDAREEGRREERDVGEKQKRKYVEIKKRNEAGRDGGGLETRGRSEPV